MSTPRAEDQFLCSICQDLFTEPVSTPCGHNFCKTCITQHWDQNVHSRCPLCNEIYHKKPDLKVNALFSEMLSEFRQKRRRKSMDITAELGDVSCDICTEPKLKALKSCLVCLTSFCETHLKSHLTVSGLKRHQLMEPVENLEERVCPKHKKPLELFCRTDQTCICMMCPLLEHKNHEFVSLKEEFDQRKSSLQQTQTETQQMMDRKIQEIRRSLELSEKSADREMTAGLQAFTDLMQSVQTSRDQFIERAQEKQRQTQKQAQDLFQELEQEISELKKRSTEVTEQVSRSKDHLQFLLSLTSLTPAVALKNWSTVSFKPASFEGTAATTLSELHNTLNEKFNKVFEAELKRVQEFAVDVTLDPDTAHPRLVLSEDLKQVHHSNVRKDLPDKPQRFSLCPCVLGKQSFSSDRFYFEVQVKGKTEWDLGVAQESINRKRTFTLSPQNGFWSIILRNRGQYTACDSPPVPLSLKHAPQKVGVFVDYNGGLVSFYDVDNSGLIYSFTGCRFNNKLLPLFSPCHNAEGVNVAPLIISTVGTKSGKK